MRPFIAHRDGSVSLRATGERLGVIHKAPSGEDHRLSGLWLLWGPGIDFEAEDPTGCRTQYEACMALVQLLERTR